MAAVAISTKAAVVIRTILNNKNDESMFCFGVQRDKKKSWWCETSWGEMKDGSHLNFILTQHKVKHVLRSIILLGEFKVDEPAEPNCHPVAGTEFKVTAN
jgi:hypothetical protein